MYRYWAGIPDRYLHLYPMDRNQIRTEDYAIICGYGPWDTPPHPQQYRLKGSNWYEESLIGVVSFDASVIGPVL